MLKPQECGAWNQRRQTDSLLKRGANMKSTMKKTLSFLLTLLLVLNILPAAAPADTGEYGQLRLGKSQSTVYVNYSPENGQDTVSLQEITQIAGVEYTDDLVFRSQNPETLTLSSDYRTLSGLTSLAEDETGSVWVYDNAGGDNKWVIHVTIHPAGKRPHCIVIRLEEGQDSITLQEIAAAAGETYTSQLGMYHEKPNTVKFTDNYQKLENLSSIPQGETGSIDIYDWATSEYAIYVTFIPAQLMTADDGIFTYTLSGKNKTATVTGFVEGLADSQKANITIPVTITWPRDGGAQYTVTAISNSAFKGDNSIETIAINASKLSIGGYAFEGCSSLNEVTDSVAGGTLTIGEFAFADCSKLKSFSSAAGIDRIYGKAFYNDRALESFTAGPGCKTLISGTGSNWTNEFQLCGGVLTFEGGIEDICIYSFYDTRASKIVTTKLDKVSENAGYLQGVELVLNIDEPIGTLDADKLAELMKNSDKFKNVTINLNKGIETLVKDAFDGISLSSYDSVRLNVFAGEKPVTVEEDCVPEATNLHVHFELNRADVGGSELLAVAENEGRVSFLDSATSRIYHDDMFWYELDTINGKAEVTGLYTEETDWEEIEFGDTTRDNLKYPVTSVREEAFKDNVNIRKITFSNTKTITVGKDAFSGMTALEELAVNNPAVTLPEAAFAGSTSLATVTLGQTTRFDDRFTIPADAFKGCAAMKKLTVNFNQVTVSNGAFDGCSGLVTVIFTGKGSQDIRTGAFADATGLKYLCLNNPYDVGKGAFAAADGTALVINNDPYLNDSLAGKVGHFETYYLTDKSPWTYAYEAFQGDVAKTVYLECRNSKIPDSLIGVLRNAGTNLTDVYLDVMREDVSFADQLESANPNIHVHFRENHIAVGYYLDGVNGNDSGDGSIDHPVKTFARAKEIIEQKMQESGGQPVMVQDPDFDPEKVSEVCAVTGVSVTPSAFVTYYSTERQIIVKNTVTVTGNETWECEKGKEITLLRDPGFKGALVNVKGFLALRNVTIDGNRTHVTAEASLIKANPGSTLNIGEGAVLRNNAYPQAGWDGNNWLNGGAVYADKATVNMNAGLIENNLAMYGGGIMMNGGTFNMNGGTIRNNTARATVYINNVKVNGAGGGVILVMGAVMNLRSGAVTGNTAEGQTSSGSGINGSTGGGIHVGSSYANESTFNNGARLNMTGGTVANNKAHAQGGGIYIHASCTATISGGKITGNESARGEFGGGGIYVNAERGNGTVNGLLKLYNVLITDNDAYYGAGIACCETVNLSMYMGSGSAIYGNKDSYGGLNHDLYIFQRQTGIGTKVRLSPQMMNGADYNWTYVVPASEAYETDAKDGAALRPDELAYLNAGQIGCVRIKSNPTNTSVNAKVIISGNKAATKGGGIGSNGNVIIGDAPPASQVSITPHVSKLVAGRDMEEGETFEFSVYLETSSWNYGNVDGKRHIVYTYQDKLVGTGTYTAGKNGEAGAIDLPAYNAGTVSEQNINDKYTLLVLEDTVSTEGMKADERTYFALTYVIGQGVDSEGKPCYKAYLFKTEKGEYTRGKDGKISFDYGTITRPGHAWPYDLRLRSEISEADAVFVNELEPTPTPTPEPTPTPTPVIETVSLSVEKQWDDMDNLDGTRPETLKVSLLANGQYQRTVVLNAENNWSAAVRDLPKTDNEGKTIAYSWQEEEIPGYEGTTATTGTRTVLTNRHEPDLVSVTVRKIWDDDNNAANGRPAKIVMKLSNGMTVTLTEENHWTATIEGLPASYRGRHIEYTWTEQTVIGYTQTGKTVNGNTTVFTNAPWKRPEQPRVGKKPKLPGRTVVSIDEYETPLGVNVIINHVGDCFD